MPRPELREIFKLINHGYRESHWKRISSVSSALSVAPVVVPAGLDPPLAAEFGKSLGSACRNRLATT
jgi:hypothetical protein